MPSRCWKRILWLGLLICLFSPPSIPAVWAQNYQFGVDRNISQVIIQPDGSADIEYWLTLTCAQGAHAIDAVDIGLPNSSYDLSTARAWYSLGKGGESEFALSAISRSPYVNIGVAVDLGDHAIQPGEQGTIHFTINVTRMVYPDSQDADYASVQFAPTFFGREFVQGTTYMEIRFLFPPGVTNEETRYHDQPFDEVDQTDDRIVFIYAYPEAKGYETHQHGISFPRKYVTIVHTAPTAAPTRRVQVPVVTSKRRFGHWIEETFERMGLPGWMALVILFYGMIFGAGRIKTQRRKMKYLPPTLSVEGVGIKRGLTAVEAAILLETPLNKVLTMILFGTLKKKGVVVLDEAPLKLEVIEPKPEANWRFYENRFLNSIQKNGTLDEQELQRMIVDLIKGVNQKLKGFSRKETVDYYRDIIDRAWKQVQAETTPEVKSKNLDRGLEWMMLDRDFERRTNETFRDVPVYMPPWWAYYRPWRTHVQTARINVGSESLSPGSSSLDRGQRTAGGHEGAGCPLSLPTLPGAAFAGTIVSGIERTAGGIVSRL
ncbi:MAG: hypothetical protein JXA89_07275, partial [Anaerolineae bacterium]|nr:hypothetical protein [Anaerolineae bacterium]